MLESAVPLPELRPASPPAHFSFSIDTTSPPRGKLIRRVTLGDREWLVIEKIPSGYCFVFPGTAVFATDATSGRITGFPSTSTEPHTMRHLLLDQVLPLHLASEGHTVLHASAVALETSSGVKALLFLGPTGAGKSSVAAGCWMAGARLIADDFSLILSEPQPAVTPALVGVRLWEDAAAVVSTTATADRFPVAQYYDKERLVPFEPLTFNWQQPVPIGALVLLGPRLAPGCRVQLTRASPVDTLMHVIEQAHRIELSSAEANREAFDTAAHIVETVPAFNGRLPTSLESLKATCSVVLHSVL